MVHSPWVRTGPLVLPDGHKLILLIPSPWGVLCIHRTGRWHGQAHWPDPSYLDTSDSLAATCCHHSRLVSTYLRLPAPVRSGWRRRPQSSTRRQRRPRWQAQRGGDLGGGRGGGKGGWGAWIHCCTTEICRRLATACCSGYTTGTPNPRLKIAIFSPG